MLGKQDKERGHKEQHRKKQSQRTSYRDVGADERGWRTKMSMELVGGAAESSCLEKVGQHGSSEEKQDGPGEELRQGKQVQQEVFGSTITMREAALRITAMSQLAVQPSGLLPPQDPARRSRGSTR